MKYLVLLFVLLCACAKPQTSTAPKMKPIPKLAGDEWCDKVYGQLLNISSNDPQFEGVNRKELLRQLDRYYHQTGAAQRFQMSCLSSMTVEQAECAFQAQSLQAIKLCMLP